MGRVAIGVGPGFLAREEGLRIGKTFGGDQALQGRQPVVIVALAVVGFTPVGCGFELVGERGGPLLPCEMTLLGKPNSKRERLRLPWLGENRAALVAGKTWQIGEGGLIP